jgi:hypothetical protein
MSPKNQIQRSDLRPGFEFLHLELSLYRVEKYHPRLDTVDVVNVATDKRVKGIPYKSVILRHGRKIK